jgi:hypothetical protein
MVEMKAFFGILLAAGISKGNMISLDVLWNKELGPPIFRAGMGQKRFKALQACIR